MMENAINCVTLFYKVGSQIKDFPRKEKFRILFIFQYKH